VSGLAIVGGIVYYIIISNQEKGQKMNSYYTDCDYCQTSFQITQFVYNFLAEGGQGLVICDECDLEDSPLQEAWA
jgi:hypothetical protein